MLNIPYDVKKLDAEWKMYCNATANKPSPYLSHNAIVKYFLQDSFYATEKKMWQDPTVREKLILNRCKYLNKSIDLLTTEDILDGFKRSGLHYGYSHFNPLAFKWFILHEGVLCCYDPCGGFGHRLLGSSGLKSYIYNDLSKSTYLNVCKIAKHFDIRCFHGHNEDAKTFIPDEYFDSMFTCPPYFNVEHYECGDFKDFDDYLKLIDAMFSLYMKTDACRCFGLVIRKDLLIGHNDYVEAHVMSRAGKKYLNGAHNANLEMMFIYRKF